MNDTEIKQELERIKAGFENLVGDFNHLSTLTTEEFNRTALKDGAANRAANNALMILKYICKDQGIVVKVKASGSGQSIKHDPGLSDYIYHVFKDGKWLDVKKEFEYIRNSRNNGIHPDLDNPLRESYAELSELTVAHIEHSMNYIMDWFFKVYLQNKYPGCVPGNAFERKILNTKYIKQNHVTQNISETESDREAIVPKNTSQPKSRYAVIAISVIIIISLAFIFKSFSSHDSEPVGLNTIPKNISSNIENVVNQATISPVTNAYRLISAYYDKLIDDPAGLNCYDFFSNNISLQVLGDTSLNTEFSAEELFEKCKKSAIDLNPEFRFNMENMQKGDKEGQWIYTDDLSAFKMSPSDEKTKIKIEFSVNADNKLSSLKETVEEASVGGS